MVVEDENGQLVRQPPREVKELRLRGETAFSDYEMILSDSTSTWEEINGTCYIISELPGNRRRFVPWLLQRLTGTNALVPGNGLLDGTRSQIRRSVLETFADIGDERDTAALIRVMNEDDIQSAFVAARTLARIGGQPDLNALNAWLAQQDPTLPYTRNLMQRRDEMNTRLRSRPSGRTL